MAIGLPLQREKFKTQIDMITPIFIWSFVALLIVAVIVAQIVFRIGQSTHHSHSHLFEIGNENELFWVPGDPTARKDDDELRDDAQLA